MTDASNNATDNSAEDNYDSNNKPNWANNEVFLGNRCLTVVIDGLADFDDADWWEIFQFACEVTSGLWHDELREIIILLILWEDFFSGNSVGGTDSDDGGLVDVALVVDGGVGLNRGGDTESGNIVL